jgi:hypothetical protein
MEFQFEECSPPRVWTGYFPRNGDHKACLHVRNVDARWQVCVDWPRGKNVVSCLAVDSFPMRDLVMAVNKAKGKTLGRDEGVFLINEYKQVLVPVYEKEGAEPSRVIYVGQINTQFLFRDPEAGTNLDLGDDSGLDSGDPWHKPCVGVPYAISPDGRIYRQKTDASGSRPDYAPMQDSRMAMNLMEIKGKKGGRFMVNSSGLVLARRTDEESQAKGSWISGLFGSHGPGPAIYVGRLDYQRWFPKEKA